MFFSLSSTYFSTNFCNTVRYLAYPLLRYVPIHLGKNNLNFVGGPRSRRRHARWYLFQKWCAIFEAKHVSQKMALDYEREIILTGKPATHVLYALHPCGPRFPSAPVSLQDGKHARTFQPRSSLPQGAWTSRGGISDIGSICSFAERLCQAINRRNLPPSRSWTMKPE